MASIENRSRFKVTVQNRDDLTLTFTHSAVKAVKAYIEELKAKRPTLEAEQRAGRARLWDRAQDREALADWNDARVPQQPYVYQTK